MDLDEPPMNIPYMRLIRRSLTHLGSWPYKVFGQDVNVVWFRRHMSLCSLWTSILVLQFIYIRDNVGQVSFLQMGHSYITTLMNIVNSHRVTIPLLQAYKDLAKMFICDMHLYHHKHKSPYAMQVYNQVHKISTFFTYMVHVQLLSGALLFNVTPVIANYRSGMLRAEEARPVNQTYQHSVYYVTPYNHDTNIYGYLFYAIFNCMLTFDVGYGFCIFDLYLSLIVFHTWGHLKILNYNLLNMRPPESHDVNDSSMKSSWYTPEESLRVMQQLKDNINHHRSVMEFVRKSTDAFGPMLFIYVIFHQVCLCILLLECSKLDSQSLSEYGVLTLILFQQLVQLSVVFELIGSKSETIKDAVYFVPWECMGVRERKVVVIFLFNVQEPITLKAMGLVPVGVRTMAAIIKTSVSYFFMLQTMAESR